MENKWHCIMMAGGTKQNCFSGRKSYLSLSVSSFIQYSLSIQSIRHPLSVSDTRPGWPLRQRGRGSQIWTLITPLLLFPILSRSQNSQTHTAVFLPAFFQIFIWWNTFHRKKILSKQCEQWDRNQTCISHTCITAFLELGNKTDISMYCNSFFNNSELIHQI